MSEERELQEKISALAGRINLHKQRESTNLHTDSTHGYGRARGGTKWMTAPYTPYGHPRGRGRGYVPRPHQNRTLVINNAANPKIEPETSSTATPGSESAPAQASTWISKRDRHMQLINSSVYEQVTHLRGGGVDTPAQQRKHQNDLEEKAKLAKYFRTQKPTHHGLVLQDKSTLQAYTITIDNIRFLVADGGSKLIRSDSDNTQDTPKQAVVGGVEFLRSKNGNLYRAGLTKTTNRTTKKSPDLCPRFATTGFCPKGPRCRYVHDPDKVAICKEFLQKGTCSAGDACDLSHDPTPHRVPHCIHFLRGNCNNESCRYAHVKVNAASPVCHPFARIGYCEKGSSCPDRHIFECPDYTNTGVCRNDHCRLPHVDRAGQLRKVAAAAAQTASASDDSSGLSSDNDEHGLVSDDIDSDDLEDDDAVMEDSVDASGHELSQQQDFIPF